ncbi:type III secretion system export apparatus subunit SctT [Rhizobacter sp. SG703]|uniref:type III secretion system export apparatus subunit SctT n=1 Tax=Rhizobacter sp. SG703 TaxID=2587140 RepID=UPI001447ABCD|nr:type III secretion system export apparatus subunit SctT [Rhizobacter sp. SG703]NKI94046.1 type III secretion protein T [Rhizobacter sp. SG703]
MTDPGFDPFTQPMQLMATYAIAMPRLLLMFSMIPVLSRESLPGLLRFGVVAAMATLQVPGLLDTVVAGGREPLAIALLVAKESLLGMVLGFLVAIPIWAFDTMGSYIDNQRGASIAQTINPLTGHDSSPLGELFSQAAVTYLLAGGGLLLMLGIAYRSFELWPVLSWTPHLSDETPGILLGQLDRLTRLAVLLGSPVILSMLLAELGLALVSRFAPQLQVFFLAMPVKSGIAMFVFAVYAGTMFDIAHDDLLDANGALDGMKAMVGGTSP